jgi:hypothetical protein
MNVLRIRNNKLELLKVLRDHVSDSLVNAEINSNLESEVAEMIADMQDKKAVKLLKVAKRELDKWIKEMELSENTIV